jgi:hypothetical protein
VVAEEVLGQIQLVVVLEVLEAGDQEVMQVFQVL